MAAVRFLILRLVSICLVLIGPVYAEDATATRVGRVSFEEGNASLKADGGEWSDAAVNDPVLPEMSLQTADKARVQLRIGPDKIALAPSTRIEVRRSNMA